MKLKSFLCAAGAIVAMLGAAKAADASIIYNVDQIIGGGSVVGTITTDGATGVLSSSDITAWSLELTGVGGSYALSNTDLNSAAVVTGNDLTATAQDLSFNFSGAPGDFFLLQDNEGSGQTYYCNSVTTGTCYGGKSDVPTSYNSPVAQFDLTASGKQVIGVSAAPEPASWALMLLGVGGLGAALRTSRRTGLVAA